MSTISLPAEHLPSAIGETSSTDAAETVGNEEITRKIIRAMWDLYNPAHKIPAEQLIGYELPSDPIPKDVSPEERQALALAELDRYKEILADPKLMQHLGRRQPARLTGHSWFRDDEQTEPVYSEVAMLNPNAALLISFDLDDAGYATSSGARLLMAKHPGVVYEEISWLTSKESRAA